MVDNPTDDIEEIEEDFDDLDFTDYDNPEVELPTATKKQAEPEEEEIVPEVEDVTAKELAQMKADYEILKQEKAQLEVDREEAWNEAEKSRTTAINGAITQWQNDLTKERRECVSLQQQHARATADGDTDKIEKLIAIYADKQQFIGQLTNNINNAHQQLNNKPVRKVAEQRVAEAPKKSAGEVMAEKWASENSWYSDPSHREKAALVNKICAELVNKKDGNAPTYDPSSLAFWRYVDKQVEEFDKKKETPRRAQPAVRPIGKPANNSGSVQSMTDKRRPDKEILTAVNAALTRRGIDKTNPKYAELQKSYYKTYTLHAKESRTNG